MSRQEVIRKLPDRTQASVVRELDRLERARGGIFESIKSITCDNGCEFLDFNAVEKSCVRAGRRCEVFFAHPYRASERGSNENANRIVRRFVPKGADISRFSKSKIVSVQNWMNALPRIILRGLSADAKVRLFFNEHTA
jgi:IS30 family transposase